MQGGCKGGEGGSGGRLQNSGMITITDKLDFHFPLPHFAHDFCLIPELIFSELTTTGNAVV